MATLIEPSAQKTFWRYAFWLAIFTIFYNVIEGLVSMSFGASDESLTLFGFGVDSFIEVISGLGILAMILRIRQSPNTSRSRFEVTALRITGSAFYLLVAGLAATSIYNIFTNHKPESTWAGMIISLISIATMWLLVTEKRRIGKGLNSLPILADANCTMVCIYMSVILLISSLIYKLTGFGLIDSFGAIGLIYFSYKEGREAFEKANGMECDCEDENCEEKK
ncbi:MAG: cation transporter [Anaerolineales bacterium]